MKYYADSSFLVSCYLLDANTATAKEWLIKTRAPLPFTDLHALEVPNAMRLGVFRRVISNTEVNAALANIDSDLLAGRLFQLAGGLAFRIPHRCSTEQKTFGD